ncbi:outer membrane receptor protein [Thioalkalivibrio denitrificans]|uniref:Outer membrane receptor protein n=1 Tax=Thioalkalivibrio denitrificans TaxID=108003 RepID=A0A1V3N886_9GAMM|nr:TonB-dependent receptor [Thioalkalivibrio denitrificans]OOG21235.1 outer membrane receptor protein [Thioalkalivibrio denitrificans]
MTCNILSSVVPVRGVSRPALLAAAVAVALSSGPAAAQEARELSRVVVTAGGFEQELVEAPASISVITREELEQQQVRNLAEALRGIEGVNINTLDARSNKTGNQTISLRGLPSEYTLVLIDGRRQNVPGTVAPNAFVDSASVFFPPIAAIERIEVIRGPMSTLYGADALGGVVNIITRRPGAERGGSAAISSTFQTDPEFGGNTTAEAYGAGPLADDRLALQVYGRVFERAESRVTWEGQNESLTDNRTMGQNPVGANVHTMGSRLTFSPDAVHDFSVGFDLTRQAYNNDRGQLGRIRRDGDGRLRDGYDTELGFNRDQIYLAHTARLPLGTVESSLTRNVTETTGRTIPEAAVPPGDPRLGSSRKLESETTVLDTKLITGMGDHLVSVGAQYIDASLTDGIPDDTFSNSQWGVFVEDEWSMTERFVLTGGLRYDNHDAFGGQTTPRVYGVWSATDTWTFKGGVGRGYRAPFLEQLHDGIVGFGNQGQDPLFGDPDLKPEISTNYEVSAHFHPGPDLTGHVTLFYTELKDKIERPTAASGMTDTFANIGEARIQGVEFAAAWRFAPAWRLSGNYTYTDSEVTSSIVQGFEKGDPLFSVPEHMINATLDWQATPALNTFLEAEYRSSSHRPDSFHEPHLGGSAQGASEALGDFKGYTLFNLGARYRFTERVTMTGVIYNLLDKDFNDYRAYPLRNDPSVTAHSNVYNNLLEPRRLWLSMNVDF